MGQSDSAVASDVVPPLPSYQPQIGDRVRFKAGKAPAALREREDAIGMVIVLVARGGSEQWPIVHFGNYITTVLPPGLLDVVKSLEGREDESEGAN